MSYPTSVGAFIPTTNIWDVSEIYQATADPKLQELLIRLYQNLNRMSLAVNIKDSGFYVTSEFVNGQQYFPNPNNNSTTATVAALRPVNRLMVNFGALPNMATKSVAHNLSINSGYTFTRIYGTASDTTNRQYIPIPTENPSVSLTVDATNVNITTFSDRSSFTICYVVLEYLKF